MISKNSKIFIAGHKGLVGSALHKKLKKEGIRDSLINYLLKYNIDSRQMIYPVSFATHFKKENKS